MKRIFQVYKELIGIIWQGSPLVVVTVVVCSVIGGVLTPFSTWVNAQVFNGAVDVAGGAPFAGLLPYLALFVVCVLLPSINALLQWDYAEPKSQLILRTAYKATLLEKLKRLKYGHLENEKSVEIIDRTFNYFENSARHLFPMYFVDTVSAVVATAGTFYLLASVRWWLILTVTIPFIAETLLRRKFSHNIYDEMEKYWKQDRRYGKLGGMLRSRDYVKENKLFGASKFLIDTYRKRMNGRNREYERFYLRHLKYRLTGLSWFSLSSLLNAGLALMIYRQGGMSVGMLISLTLLFFGSLNGQYSILGMCVFVFTWGEFHIRHSFDWKDKFFALSEDEYGDVDGLPADFDIEFDNVYFTYPETEKEILKGLTFKAKHGEKLSIVGQNGEGKTTMIKLLLGLFEPTSGTIRIGGKPLSAYTQKAREKMFGAVFQDFVKYSITLGENVGVGNAGKMNDPAAVDAAMKKGKADALAAELADGKDALLGRDFEGGVDVSGGQWQRVAISRAFMGDKPILILDEPTSQLDPMAESAIYNDFAEMSAGKTAIFITHRLGSTLITDRILVVSEGRVTQEGTHDELMSAGGLYADMFNAQRQWYVKKEEA